MLFNSIAKIDDNLIYDVHAGCRGDPLPRVHSTVYEDQWLINLASCLNLQFKKNAKMGNIASHSLIRFAYNVIRK